VEEASEDDLYEREIEPVSFLVATDPEVSELLFRSVEHTMDGATGRELGFLFSMFLPNCLLLQVLPATPVILAAPNVFSWPVKSKKLN